MSNINWYEQDVIAKVADASAEFLLAMAFQVEAEAKPNVPVDTGFLRNSSYVKGAGTDTFTPRQDGDRETVSSILTPADGEVVVGFAADYAVYQEIKNNFLHSALQRVAAQAGGIIESVGKKHFD